MTVISLNIALPIFCLESEIFKDLKLTWRDFILNEAETDQLNLKMALK